MTESRPIPAITPAMPAQGWERFRDDAREAILARLLNVAGKEIQGAGNRSTSPNLPTGLVRATVLQAHSKTEATVDIGGKPYLVNTRQALTTGATIVLRIIDERGFQAAAEAKGDPARLPADGGRRGPPAPLSAGTGGSEGAERAGAARQTRGVAPILMPALAELKTQSGDTKVMLSGSSRLLLALVDEIGGMQRSVPLAPLRLEAGLPSPEIAHRLQQAVAQSGLFYESHLQEWREGRRRLETLRAEPQAALSPPPRAKEQDLPAPPPPNQAPPEPSTPEQNANKGLQAALNAIPQDLRPLVQDQIAVLVSGRLFLEGAFGEQPFTLEIEPEPHPEGGDAELPMAWRVRIVVDAPHLGKLNVEVALSGTDARVAIQPDAKTVRGQKLRDLQAQLMAGGVELQQALDSQGLQMSDLKVTTASRSPARTAAS